MVKVLTDLCLKTIVDYFPRYNLAFNATEDDDTKRRFEFLQRKYSLDLLTRLTHKQKMVDDYVDLLINKHLKELNTDWFENCSWEKVASKIAEMGSIVEKVRFNEVDVPEETSWQDMICYFSNLRSFSFHAKGYTDLVIKLVANFCRNIEEIRIEYSTVTSEGVKYLLKNENGEALCLKLRKLYIEGAEIEEDDVKHLLKNLPSLEVLGFAKLPLMLHSMHKNDLSSLHKAERYNIIELNLTRFRGLPHFDDIQKVCLTVCPRLKSLTCGFRKNDDINLISNLSELQKLKIRSLIYTQKMNVDALLKCVGGKLTSLTLVDCSISVSVLFESCPRIEDLTVKAVDIGFDKTSKSTVYSLRSLTFKNCSFSQNIMAIRLLLSSAEKWETLAFWNCELLSSEIKAEILKCCETHPIKELSFTRSKIEKEFIKDLLSNCYNLSAVGIECCFDKHVYHELLKFAANLPKKPQIYTGIGMFHPIPVYHSDDMMTDDYDL